MLCVALVLSEEHTVYSRREAIIDGRYISAESGVIMFPGSRLQIDGLCLYDL